MGGKNNDNLTLLQENFVTELLADPNLNATDACIRAGFQAKNRESAANKASSMMKMPKIKAEIARRRAESFKKLHMCADEVLAGLAVIARVDIADLFNKDGTLKPLQDIPKEVRKAIAGVEVEELFAGKGEDKTHIGRVRKVKFWDKVKALETLAKHLRLLVDKVDVRFPDGINVNTRYSPEDRALLKEIAVEFAKKKIRGGEPPSAR